MPPYRVMFHFLHYSVCTVQAVFHLADESGVQRPKEQGEQVISELQKDSKCKGGQCNITKLNSVCHGYRTTTKTSESMTSSEC